MDNHSEIHAIVNEVPAFLIGGAALFMALGWIKDLSWARTFAYVTFVVCGAWNIVLFASGEATIASVGVAAHSQDLIAAHHRFATIATMAIEACLVLAILTALTEKNRSIYRVAAPTLVALAIVAFLAIVLVANIGYRMVSG